MYVWIIRQVMVRSFGQLGNGDPEPALKAFARGARVVFPGQHSWEIHNVAVAGPPWNMRVFIRARPRRCTRWTGLRQPVVSVRVRWGKLSEDRIFIDTQRVAQLDEMLAEAPT